MSISKFIEHFENRPLGFGLWISCVLCILFIRDGIEAVVSYNTFSIANRFHLLHCTIFFISLLPFIIIILHLFSKTEIQKVSKVALIPFSIIIFPALIDFVFGYFAKIKIVYTYIQGNLWINMLRFLDPTYVVPELPRTIRLEIASVVFMSFIYIYFKRRKVLAAVLGAVSIYLACFLYVSIPAVLAEYAKLMKTLNIKNFPLPEGVMEESVIVLLQLIIITVLAGVWLWRYDPKKYDAVIKNMRPMRSLHYAILFILGVFIHSFGSGINNFFMLIRLFGSLLSLFFAFQFSVVINDIFDTDCDRISNAGRPLVTGVLDRRQYLNIASVYLTLSLLFAYWVNPTCMMIVLLFVCLYFIYSTPPFRLKRFYPVSIFIIGLQAVLAFALGEASFARVDPLSDFHTSWFWPIFVIFSLAANIKDLKDIEGDRQTGVITLPVLLGEKIGRYIIAFLVSLSYLLVPYFLHPMFPNLKIYILSICFALASFIYICKRNAQEKIIFLIYFLYTLILIFSLKRGI